MRWQLFGSLVLIIGFTLSSQVIDIGLADEKAQSDNRLSIVLSTSSSGNHPHIKGYYIYVKDGKDIRKEIEKVGGWGWTFRGEYIKEVNVEMVAGDGVYQLFVTENHVTVFESGPVSTSDPVIYKKN
ncbi:hypothetical protein BMS3Abin10_00958 [bacterium BMS3Abin10]|nr:hypothetical protein BMS3Abin10_00958 [bacterium BMS3Abin10]GBE39794.1 hypothetical protein BMS3Bbin08_02425 [bacterium BMS3Bbin08]HDH50354.1 hypothetical protein [Nitrospirota bacterium]